MKFLTEKEIHKYAKYASESSHPYKETMTLIKMIINDFEKRTCDNCNHLKENNMTTWCDVIGGNPYYIEDENNHNSKEIKYFGCTLFKKKENK